MAEGDEVGQPDLVRMRILRLAAPHAAPTKSTPPTFVLSPQTPTGKQTGGFVFMLTQPGSPATPGVGGFLLTFWIRNPINGEWGAGVSFFADYNQAFVAGDVDACELYLEISNVVPPEIGPAATVDFQWCEEGCCGSGLRRLFGGQVPAAGGPMQITLGEDEGRSATVAQGEVIVYEYEENFDDATPLQVVARLSGIVRDDGGGTGFFRIYTGATGPGSTAGATLRATMTTIAAADETQTAVSAAFANPGGKVLVQVTAQSVGAASTARIRGMSLKVG